MPPNVDPYPAIGPTPAEGAGGGPLLCVESFSVGFEQGQSVVPVLRNVSFEVRRGEIFALVGESGCGKSLTALGLMGLLPEGGRVLGGAVGLDGAGDLVRLGESARRRVRGGRMAMIFQEPAGALNPVLSIGFQIIEVLRLHRGMGRRQARAEARELLARVAMPDPEERLAAYPHQLSGGQQQRAMIAMALAGNPDLLVADEPTTALDVTVQAQVLRLLLDLRRDLDLSVLLITHDLGVVAECADRVGVMYAGEIVELAGVHDLFDRPAHPYTRALLSALPRLSGGLPEGIPGRPPEPGELPGGCAFAPRCSEAIEACHHSPPAWVRMGADRGRRCLLVQPVDGPGADNG